MQPSNLRLETYHYTKIVVVPRPDAQIAPAGQYVDFNNVEFGSEVTIGEIVNPDGLNSHKTILLELKASPSGNSKFPYDIDIGAIGVFDVSGLPAEKQEVLLLVNGSSMLYSALREALLTMTFRCTYGPVMLPSVHFVQLEKQYTENQAAKAGAMLSAPVDTAP